MPARGRTHKPERSIFNNAPLLLSILILVLAFLAFPRQAAAGQNSAAPSKTLWLIPHTHWEGAVFKTREEYLQIGLPHILHAMELLKKYPEYRFVLDQVAYVKPFLERYPAEEATFRKFVTEGRIQLVGAQNIMPDMNIPSGESWIRQSLYGKSYYREKLGVDVTVGWGLDSFGHHPQLPQMLKLAGYQSYWFQRGVKADGTPSEFLWQGIDGTKIPAFWLPLSYGLFHPAPGNSAEFDGYTRELWDGLGKYSTWPDRVALVGADVTDPEEAVPLLTREFNQQVGAPVALRFGLPTDFEKAAAARPNPPVVAGDLNPVFQGVYSSRIELKQWVRTLERHLGAAETLNAIASWLGAPSAEEKLAQAWEPVLFNQAHDLMSGTMVDKVYGETVRDYELSKKLADEMIDSDLNAIAARVDTRGEGIPFIVFNNLGWPRTDGVETEVEISERGFAGLRLTDAAGKDVPIQLVSAERHADGGIRKARFAFVARDVPALGYALYRVLPSRAGSSTATAKNSASTWHEDSGSMENEFYRATFDLWTGEITRLQVKSGDWNALGEGPGNVVAREQDGGDLWELYGNLNGARLTAMTRKSLLPAPWRAHYSHEWVGGDGRVDHGPVFSQFSISHPFGDGKFSTRVRLFNGIRRVDFKTEILNNDKLVRYRMLFPTSLKSGRRFDEIPFGAVERPIEQEFPAQNWMDFGDGARGVALLNRGIPGHNVAGGVLMLSLLRSASISAYPFIGGYEAGVSSDLGLELGVERSFDYALVPHEGDWQAAEIYRAGWEFNHPLVVGKISTHPGSLPSRWGLLEVSQNNVVVSALKPGEGGAVVVRVYEAAGRKADGVKIKVSAGVASAQESNLMEDAGGAIQVSDNAFQFSLQPFEIKTFKLKLQPSAARK
jgi:alpha-mannosidase